VDPLPPVDVEPEPPVIPDPGPDPDPEPLPPVIEPEPPVVPIPVPPEVIDLSKTFKVNVSFYGSQATAARKAKYLKAVELVKKVVALSAFKDRILNYDSTCTVNKFYQTTKSNAQIYGHILNGNEVLQPLIDNEMDVEVEFYYAATNTIGYTYPSSKRIWVNTKYFDTYTPRSVAANLMHEWMHKLGYGHDSAATTCRPYSVPYAVGYMVRDLGKQFE
jgi:hypothetical protein